MQGHTSNLQLLKKQLDRTFKKEKDRQKAHATSSKILEDLSTNNTLLGEILRSNLNKRNFFSQEHYPVLAFPICASEHYELIANVWIPLASKSTEYSTKSIHHHGPMLLTTVTAFGPGYFHYLFDRPVRDESESNVGVILNGIGQKNSYGYSYGYRYGYGYNYKYSYNYGYSYGYNEES